jgi:hypothetical protein
MNTNWNFLLFHFHICCLQLPHPTGGSTDNAIPVLVKIPDDDPLRPKHVVLE